MLVLGIVLIVLAIAGVVWGSLSMAATSYSPPFASPEAVDDVCKTHIKPLGTPSGASCGLLVKNTKGHSVSCRKGVVNGVGNECVANAEHLGPGLIAGSVLVLVAGIVCVCIKDEARQQVKRGAKHDGKHGGKHK